MRFDEGTILGIYPDLFTLAVARNCLAFVRRTFGVRMYIYMYLLRRSFVSMAFSPENSPERTSRHLARAPLGARPEFFARRAASHERGPPSDSSSLEIESHPRTAPEKLSTIVTAILGRLLTTLLLQALSPDTSKYKSRIGTIVPQTKSLLIPFLILFNIALVLQLLFLPIIIKFVKTKEFTLACQLKQHSPLRHLLQISFVKLRIFIVKEFALLPEHLRVRQTIQSGVKKKFHSPGT